ncbi:MOSC domain-containing protein [Nocardioides aurantiacus]|uniref:MOSC domain-containing protein n=1 Tax=Nocardioides aurantiacus TaxID=86796 RepID=A0A3N2CTA5_9ACTN|nr:MOSC domain-containing protein [Nocardioides aurantiacus]ROR90769.1 MOSC domain-containing protein [Nocardioides aurantiacus]
MDAPSIPDDPRPTVLALHVAPERHAPVRAVTEVVAEAGAGLVGDRFHGTRHRHVSLQSATDLDAAADELGRPVEPGGTRRNVTLSHGEVPTEPGARVRIGDVELEVVRLAAPCRLMEDSLGPGGRTALRRRGGSVLRVLHGGTIRVGDPVDLPVMLAR